ncbi:hypothetical protein [Pseudobacteriovorax antillogorgiicola]|uniref:Transcriptional regulatory protein, C terminal n=1 Tax=Pseudobacteriovorax antillogorgiicola TaxID=1513793 RepID=A0A1Y6C838_9BACT|nr:hypothetical protein [Pseudobacteriovorax antillogorgiicola]TCS51793.1 hypothetical protein EDD56_110178 [Pseudobacteriovorax antillogorgiicola]SMF50027.1 hypothetical protein SAMN06296036_115147 [Pseudobacteriovorax antillogorgiicola]
MDWNSKVDEIKNLCYQCEFRKVVEAVDRSLVMDPGSDPFFKMQLYKSQALFEMHKVNDAKALLRHLTEHEEKQSDFYLYVMAKLHYSDKEWEKAIRLFRLLADKSESVREYFKAILGLTNSYFSIRKTSEIKRLLPELEELLDVVPLDQDLSFRLLKANVFYSVDNNIQKAKRIFQEVIRKSIPHQWNYFIIKSLFGLSSMYQETGRSESLEATLDLMHCYLNTDESVYLTYLVNERFKDNNFTLSSPLQFDHEFKRIAVQGKWIPLHDKPLIYNFLDVLHRKEGFVNKEQIAAQLWPDQQYKPRTHDPRIFDLARRIRALIEPYENQPVCLLSGRFGYKLASKDRNIEVNVNHSPAAPTQSAAHL